MKCFSRPRKVVKVVRSGRKIKGLGAGSCGVASEEVPVVNVGSEGWELMLLWAGAFIA